MGSDRTDLRPKADRDSTCSPYPLSMMSLSANGDSAAAQRTVDDVDPAEHLHHGEHRHRQPEEHTASSNGRYQLCRYKDPAPVSYVTGQQEPSQPAQQFDRQAAVVAAAPRREGVSRRPLLHREGACHV
ncbi:energy transducer TonB [Babesia caballi]|uniref:Energy transducer TonB n=1 Tax=Babesia caballi TaxID=5871 RepID=A0AAV4LTZ5_BABCB|nr:energy transducer TonB [Babesia caballi]